MQSVLIGSEYPVMDTLLFSRKVHTARRSGA
jgi:hypothetical protein